MEMAHLTHLASAVAGAGFALAYASYAATKDDKVQRDDTAMGYAEFAFEFDADTDTDVELRPVRFERGEVLWCSPREAQAYAVYVGSPGNYRHVADFANYADARVLAERVRELLRLNLHDHAWDAP